MGQEILLENWKTTKAGTIEVDWLNIEKVIGFELHENFKDLYSRILAGEGHRKSVRGVTKFYPEAFVKEYIYTIQPVTIVYYYEKFCYTPLKTVLEEAICHVTLLP